MAKGNDILGRMGITLVEPANKVEVIENAWQHFQALKKAVARVGIPKDVYIDNPSDKDSIYQISHGWLRRKIGHKGFSVNGVYYGMDLVFEHYGRIVYAHVNPKLIRVTDETGQWMRDYPTVT